MTLSRQPSVGAAVVGEWRPDLRAAPRLPGRRSRSAVLPTELVLLRKLRHRLWLPSRSAALDRTAGAQESAVQWQARQRLIPVRRSRHHNRRQSLLLNLRAALGLPRTSRSAVQPARLQLRQLQHWHQNGSRRWTCADWWLLAMGLAS